MYNNKILEENIEREKRGIDFCYPQEDKVIFEKMISEINCAAGTSIKYLAELDYFRIEGVGEIIAKYITQFSSQGIKAYLLPNLVVEKVKGYDKLVLQLYTQFRNSSEYLGKEGLPSPPAHITIRYDYAFRFLKPKRLAKELIMIVRSPRDAFYLPFTMRMLASWKRPEMEELLRTYLLGDWNLDKGWKGENWSDNINIDYMRRELVFTAIEGLKYYPTAENREIIETYANKVSDEDILIAVEKTLKRYLTRI